MPSSESSAAKRAPLTRERVVDAAIALLQECGLDALSTRGLAQRLGVQAPALYWHIRNKEQLLALVADAICVCMQLPARDLPFRARLGTIGSEYRRVLLAHRDAPRIFAEHAPLGPRRLQLYEEAVSAFLDRGFPIEEAAAMATFFRHFLLGMVTEEARQQRADTPGTSAVLGSDLGRRNETAAEHPLLMRAAPALAAIDSAQLFDLGLNVLLDGMELRAVALRAAAGVDDRVSDGVRNTVA